MLDLKPHPCNTGFRWEDHAGPFCLLTDQQAVAFDNDGFVLLEGVLDVDALAALETKIDGFEARAEEWLRSQPGGSFSIATADAITFTTNIAARDEDARQLVGSAVLTDLCLDLVGPDVDLFWDQAVYKKPEKEREFPWHQDNGYGFVDPQAYLTCWIPLTPATVDNGCPFVVPGLHRHGTLAHWESAVGRVCFEADEVQGAQAMEAQPGDVVVFSSLTPHRTGPNTTDAVRKAYIVQYSPAGARRVEAAGAAEPEALLPVLAGGQRQI
jgi:ectoine hydroxylase-related dioxygenase (phytanoyl-CoA dioxygenase family)